MSELDDAIAKASTEAESEAKGEEVATPEEPVKEEASAEPEKEAEAEETPKAEKKDDEEEEPLGLTAEELAEINSNPKLLKTYKSMQRGLTKKSQGIAEFRKGAEESVRMIEYIRANRSISWSLLYLAIGASLYQHLADKSRRWRLRLSL